MTDFKIGDRIKAKSIKTAEVLRHFKEYWRGDGKTNEFTVRTTSTGYDGVRNICISQGAGGPQWPASFFELITETDFKAGDRVRYVGTWSPWLHNDTGTVVSCQKRPLNNVDVKWDSGQKHPGVLRESLVLIAVPNKFKVGDVIKHHFDSKTRHVVSEVRSDGHVRFDQFPTVGYFKPDAFDLWSDHEPTPNPAIVALVVDGQPRPSSQPYVHATTESATTEAERLSVANPGHVFAVYERVTARIADKPVARVAA